MLGILLSRRRRGEMPVEWHIQKRRDIGGRDVGFIAALARVDAESGI
jgi:hypothetical protein